MVFSSIVFLFRFLPAVLFIYYVAPTKMKNLVLLIVSLIFYSWGEPRYVLIMFASIMVDYTASRGIEHFRGNEHMCKLFLIISVVFNLGLLFFFKYSNFFIRNMNSIFGLSVEFLKVALPLGISFYTFQTMSYTIDVYRGKVEAEKNIIDFGAFVTLFPQLIAGPIVKYTDINKALKSRVISMPQINSGVETFILGLGSKVLIANNIGMLWTEVQSIGFTNVSTPLTWLGVIAFFFQLYFDFSGYSLMAIGLGKMLGFEFPQNFNYPYISRSATELWSRWHMTLGAWFKEYLYIPLGGNRVSPVRLYINLFIVWFLTGFWHGADYNFILWGLFFYMLLCIEKAGFIKFLDKHRVLSHIYLIFVILIGWALFAVTDLRELGTLYLRMFSGVWGTDWIYYLRNYGVVLILAALLSTPAVKIFFDKNKEIKWAKTAIIVLVFLLSVAYLVDATYNPFLYFRF